MKMCRFKTLFVLLVFVYSINSSKAKLIRLDGLKINGQANSLKGSSEIVTSEIIQKELGALNTLREQIIGIVELNENISSNEITVKPTFMDSDIIKVRQNADNRFKFGNNETNKFNVKSEYHDTINEQPKQIKSKSNRQEDNLKAEENVSSQVNETRRHQARIIKIIPIEYKQIELGNKMLNSEVKTMFDALSGERSDKQARKKDSNELFEIRTVNLKTLPGKISKIYPITSKKYMVSKETVHNKNEEPLDKVEERIWAYVPISEDIVDDTFKFKEKYFKLNRNGIALGDLSLKVPSV